MAASNHDPDYFALPCLRALAHL